jgi:hypothetical protein
MSGNDYAALYATVTASLASGHTYGRDGRHTMGACSVCHIHVCLTHHACPGKLVTS